MDDTSGLRGLGTVPDGPLSDLVGTRREEAAQVQDLTHGGDEFGEGGLDAEVLELGQGFWAVASTFELRKTLFEGDGYGEDGIASSVFLDPFRDLAEMLVLLSDVVLLAQVDEVDDWLGSQEEERVNVLDL